MAVNETLLDRWSAVHGLMGLGVGAAGVKPPLALGGALVFDVVEHLHESPHGSKLFGSKAPESPLNVLGDLLVYGAAYLGGRALQQGRHAPLVTVGAFGLAALLGIVYAHRGGCACPTDVPAEVQS